jgi:acetyl-CoA synthetase
LNQAFWKFVEAREMQPFSRFRVGQSSVTIEFCHYPQVQALGRVVCLQNWQKPHCQFIVSCRKDNLPHAAVLYGTAAAVWKIACSDTVMNYPVIRKDLSQLSVQPNMLDYRETRTAFSWDAIRREFDGINIAHVAIDRHAAGTRANQLALRWLGRDGEVRDFTYGGLRDETNRFANVLSGLGVAKGDRVFLLAGRIPELYIAALGTLKSRSVFCPLFSAFGPEPLYQRLSLGDASVLVTTAKLYRKKVVALRQRLPQLKHVLLVDGPEDRAAGVWSLPELMAAASPQFNIAPTEPEDMALLHFTSGTTGRPKGAIHVHGAVAMHYMTGKYALDFHAGDIFWCTADPGWVTGTSYGIISPLVHGITSIVDEGDFDPERWYRTLEDQQVTVWYTAPTAIRMLMRSAVSPRQFDLRRLRFIASVGEPLNAEAVVWGKDAIGLPIHDNWWQTETGGIMIANYAAVDIRPGSMGLPLPGVEADIINGELALKPGWPSMFRGYLHDDERYRKCFHDGWYFTGDLACRDADGYYWFLGRADDVIKTAGHMVGPFEVESVLMAHPAVSEAGVIGKPDPVIGDVVKAFITLKPGFEATDALRLELIGFARERLGPAVAPKEIEFKETLPHTRSAKIMRRLLRARELGLPEGDLSTLETSE